jgi:hypothetical protein
VYHREQVASDDSGQRLVVADGFNGIFVSNDYGSSWVKPEGLPTDAYYWRVVSDSTGQYMIATLDNYFNGYDYGLFDRFYLRSADFGVTWQGLVPPVCFDKLVSAGAIWYAVCSNYQDATLAVVKSTDHGLTWSVTTLLFNYDPNTLLTDSSGRYVYLSSSGAEIFVSDDFGSTWIKRYEYILPGHESVKDAICDRSGQYVRVKVCSYWGDSQPVCDWVIYSNDYGTTWYLVPSETPELYTYVNDIYAIRSGKLCRAVACPSDIQPNSPSRAPTSAGMRAMQPCGVSSASQQQLSYRIVNSTPKDESTASMGRRAASQMAWMRNRTAASAQGPDAKR